MITLHDSYLLVEQRIDQKPCCLSQQLASAAQEVTYPSSLCDNKIDRKERTRGIKDK